MVGDRQLVLPQIDKFSEVEGYYIAVRTQQIGETLRLGDRYDLKRSTYPPDNKTQITKKKNFGSHSIKQGVQEAHTISNAIVHICLIFN